MTYSSGWPSDRRVVSLGRNLNSPFFDSRWPRGDRDTATPPSWSAIPTVSVNRGSSFPLAFTNFSSPYLTDPDDLVTGISLVGNDLTQVSYDYATDTLTIASDPGPEFSDSMQLRATTASGSYDSSAFTVEDAAGNPVTQSIVAEYVDTSGARQRTTIVDGVTNLVGVSPFCIHLDFYGCRSSASGANATTEAGAFHNLGHRIDWDDQLGSTWAFSGDSMDEDVGGPPIYGRPLQRVGAHTIRIRTRDLQGNERTLSFTATVQAPPTATNIPVSAGSWPTLSSSSHYTLDAGGDYSSFGTLDTRGLHNVVISKTGSGADPIIGTWEPDGRHFDGSLTQRASHIRLVDIDVGTLADDAVGFDHCAVVRGRVRRYTSESRGYWYDTGASTNAERDSVRYSRGLYLWDTGEMNSKGSGTGTDRYVMIDAVRMAHFAGVDFHKNNSNSGEHLLRNTHLDSSYRHCRLRCSAATVHIVKQQSGGLTDIDYDDDRHGVSNGSSGFGGIGWVNRGHVFHRCEFVPAGSTRPDEAVPIKAQNNDGPPFIEGHEFSGYEDCFSGQNDMQNFNQNVTGLGGRELFQRGVQMADGSFATVFQNANPNGLTADFRGPYVAEASASSRPIPSAF